MNYIEELISLFKEYLLAWSWEEWQVAGACDREEIVINAIADLGPDIDIDEAYDIFTDWSAGLTSSDFGEEMKEDISTTATPGMTKLRCIHAWFENDDGYIENVGVYMGDWSEEKIIEGISEAGMMYVDVWDEYEKEVPAAEAARYQPGNIVDVFDVDNDVIDAFAEENGLDPEDYKHVGFFENLNESTTEDPYGYGPYKTFSDPDLKVGDYVLTTRPFSTGGRTYPARITSVSPKWIEYVISGFGFTDKGTKARSGSATDKVLRNTHAYLKNM